jgi:hypothetical protein
MIKFYEMDDSFANTGVVYDASGGTAFPGCAAQARKPVPPKPSTSVILARPLSLLVLNGLALVGQRHS